MHIVLGEALRPSLQQLCANVLGHLNTKGLYPSLKVMSNKTFYTHFYNSTALPLVFGLCVQWVTWTIHFWRMSFSIFFQDVACKYSCFSLLLAARNILPGGTSVPQWQKFHTDDVKSLQNLVRSCTWSA